MIDAYATGSSLPALLAALELAEVGLRVRVAVGAEGGRLPETPVADPEGTLTALMERLARPIADGGAPHPGMLPRLEPPAPTALTGRNGEWALQPEPAILGIPAVPLSERSLAILGAAAGSRAYLDRIKPLLTIGKTRVLGPLVRARLGRAVCERLVEPLVRERFGLDADSVEVAVAAPGLNEAMTRAGSLSGAVLACSERNVARETRVEPAEGWDSLRATLLERLALYGAELVDSTVRSVRRGEAQWIIAEEDGHCEARALILDRGIVGSPLPAGVGDDPHEARDRARAVARVSVEQSAWAGPAVSAAEAGPAVDAAQRDAASGAAALRVVTLRSGEVWTARVVAGRGTGWTAELRGPASSRAVAEQHAAARAAEALEAADLTARGEIRCALVAAPYATVAEREAAEERAAETQRTADPGLLLVGEAVVGGDLSSALRAAGDSAIALRRHLTGIAE